MFEQRVLAATLCIFVLGVNLGLHLRFIYGFDGSDQMQSVVWGGLVAFHATDSLLVQHAAVFFVAAQLVLSYLTAGIAKLISPIWRSGQAVGLIMRTKTYGTPWLSRTVKQLHLSGPLSWATILFEVVGPLSVLAGPKPTLLFLAAGMLFHISIAIAMGLNTFVWAFTATFPAVYYASQFLNWYF